jgi:hypothetical protein
MGRRGPLATPDVLRQLKGNPGHRTKTRRRPAVMPSEPPVVIEPPSCLTGRERLLFLTVVTDSVMRRILRPEDAWALARWASHQADWEAGARDDAPLRELRRLERALTTLESRLGLTPGSRMRLLAGMGDQVGS